MREVLIVDGEVHTQPKTVPVTLPTWSRLLDDYENAAFDCGGCEQGSDAVSVARWAIIAKLEELRGAVDHLHQLVPAVPPLTDQAWERVYAALGVPALARGPG